MRQCHDASSVKDNPNHRQAVWALCLN